MSNTPVPRSELSAWIVKVQDTDTKQYICDRVMDQMNFYKKKSREYKKKYNFWMTASIIISLLIPVVSIFADAGMYMKAIIALLGGGTAAITAYLRLHNYLELWGIYRNNREYLFSVLYSYFTATGIFRKLSDQAERDALLIETCEGCFNSENKQWRELLRMDDEQS